MPAAPGTVGKVSESSSSRLRPLTAAIGQERTVSHRMVTIQGGPEEKEGSPATMEAGREPQAGDTRLYRLRTRYAVPIKTNMRVVART